MTFHVTRMTPDQFAQHRANLPASFNQPQVFAYYRQPAPVITSQQIKECCNWRPQGNTDNQNKETK